MLCGEALGHRDGLLILDLAGETAAPLGVRESLPLHLQLTLGARQGVADFADGDLRFDDRFTHLSRQVPQIPSGRIHGGPERVPEALEQGVRLAQLLRTVLAKNWEKTGSTARESHFGQAGLGRPACCDIDWVRANRFLHLVQRYS
jgi:hypothetical protein